ncbi:MAG: hypothetical protein LQ351_001047 [Letrouitia transgressa]|nr:MAG: hypothetical protein LQ351_001047 [Letrouitia transgressa]
MTAVMPPSPSPSSSSANHPRSPKSPNLASLPPLNTHHPRYSNLQRPPSYARNRMSSYSTHSNASQNRSRPSSHAFPHFHSSLSYALVRDFAYPIVHPYHYGPPPEPSGVQSEASTPVSERSRRLSDPPLSWDNANAQWPARSWMPDESDSTQQLPQRAYGDGPPYSEDEDLHSPVVVSSRQKRRKSGTGAFGGNGKTKARSPRTGDGEDDEGESYFDRRNGGENAFAYSRGSYNRGTAPAEDLVTYPPDQSRASTLAPSRYAEPGQRDSHFAGTLPNRTYRQEDLEDSDDASEVPSQVDDSRYSKDYQFTIASPDEEMHGKAVALFDFTRENENELPLIEGQVIWVSYRHGQGWLVAEDPKTRESGLVPEEYVRLLRDIEGGWNSLSGDVAEEHNQLSPDYGESQGIMVPTQAEPSPERSTHPSNGSGNGHEKRPPIVSTFSTSSKDLNPYPHRLLEKQAGQSPPSVVHYNSQTNTPTVSSPMPANSLHRGLSDPVVPQKQSARKSEEDSESSGEDEFHDSKEE